MSMFIGAALIPENKLRQTVDSFIADYRLNGKLPSLAQGNRSPCYDFGLLLYAVSASIGVYNRGIIA